MAGKWTLITALALASALPCLAQDGGETRLKASDFGAIADDGKDDSEAFARALERCRALEGRKTLEFQSGAYEFSRQGKGQDAISIEGVKSLRIEGNGAEFILHGPFASFMRIARCSDIEIRGLRLDWARPPSSHGSVMDVKAGSHFDLLLPQEFRLDGKEQFESVWQINPKISCIEPFNCIEIFGLDRGKGWRCETRGAGILRIAGDNDAWAALRFSETLSPGMTFLLRQSSNDGKAPPYRINSNAVYVRDSENVSFEEVEIYSAAGMGFATHRNRNLSFKSCAVKIRPGSGHLISTNVDGFHFSETGGALLVENCLAEATGDDGINIKGCNYYEVKEIMPGGRLRLGPAVKRNVMAGAFPEKGSFLAIDPESGQRILEGRAVASKTLQVFEPGFKHMESIVELDRPIPASLKPGALACCADYLPDSVTVRGFEARGNRGRGMLLQAPNAKIESCRFSLTQYEAIRISHDPAMFGEGVPPSDVSVRGCVFENCDTTGVIGAISIFPMTPAAPSSLAPDIVPFLLGEGDGRYKRRPPGVFKNIALEGNSISGVRQTAILAMSVDGLKARGNVLKGVYSDARRPNWLSAAIYADDCANVEISGNRLDNAKIDAPFADEREKEGFKPESRIRLGAGAKGAKLEGNEGFSF